MTEFGKLNRDRIVIINLPTKHLKSDTEIVNLGPLFIHSYLKKNNIDSIFIDLAGTKYERWDMIPDSDIYGISAVTCQIYYADALAKFLKERNPKACVIMGGAHATALPEDCIERRNADAVVCGEGEEIILKMMQSTKPLHGIYKCGSVEKDIEKYYPLRFEDLGIYRYLKPGVFRYMDRENDTVQFDTMVARGCYGKCKFCMNSKRPSHSIRHRNIKNMVDELIEYKKRYGITRVYFSDDELLTKKSLLNELCKEMPRSSLNWLCLGRADRIDLYKLGKMVNAGCTGILLGIESFSDKVLKGLNKNITAKQNLEALILCSKFKGFKVRAQMMVGCIPYEDRDDIEQTASFVRQILLETDGTVKFSFHIFQPLPGTISYDEALKDSKNWDPTGLRDYSQFQTVGDFQHNIKLRPEIAHKNPAEIYGRYDYLVSVAGQSEVSHEGN